MASFQEGDLRGSGRHRYPVCNLPGWAAVPKPPHMGLKFPRACWVGEVLYFCFISMDFTDPLSSSRIIDGESGVPDPIE